MKLQLPNVLRHLECRLDSKALHPFGLLQGSTFARLDSLTDLQAKSQTRGYEKINSFEIPGNL